MDQTIYANRVDENHIKISTGSVTLHFTPEDAKDLLVDSGDYNYGNSVVSINENTIEIVPNWGSSWSNGLLEPFYRIIFNKKQFQDKVLKALNPSNTIDVNINDLNVGDIILHSKEPHKIITKDILWSKDRKRKIWYGKVMNLITGEVIPYQFTWSYSAIKMTSFIHPVEEANGCDWAFGVNSNEYTSSVKYVWWAGNKFVVNTI